MTTELATQFVYYIAGAGATKVGITGDPEQRLAALQSACPSPLRLVYFSPGTQRVESQVHRLLRERWLHHEWFSGEVTPEEAAALTTLALREVGESSKAATRSSPRKTRRKVKRKAQPKRPSSAARKMRRSAKRVQLCLRCRVVEPQSDECHDGGSHRFITIDAPDALPTASEGDKVSPQ